MLFMRGGYSTSGGGERLSGGDVMGEMLTLMSIPSPRLVGVEDWTVGEGEGRGHVPNLLEPLSSQISGKAEKTKNVDVRQICAKIHDILLSDRRIIKLRKVNNPILEKKILDLPQKSHKSLKIKSQVCAFSSF
jgi:hypothetical protein